MTQDTFPGTHLDADQLSAFAEGALPEHERLQCMAHLAGCSRCRDIAFLAQEPLPQQVAAAGPTPFWQKWLTPLPIAGLATAALAAVLFVTLRGRTPEAPHPAEIASMETQSASPGNLPAAPQDRPAPMPERMAGAMHTREYEAAPSPRAASNATMANGALTAPQAPAAVAGSIVTAEPPLSAKDVPENGANGLALSAGVVQATGHSLAAKAMRKDAPLAAAPAPATAAAQPQVLDGAEQQLAIQNRNFVPSAASAAAAGAAMGAPLRMSVERGGPAGSLSTISGTVTDMSGATIPGASVAARQIDGVAKAEVKADALGHFGFAPLPAGRYEVQITSPGFTAFSQQVTLQSHDLAMLHPVLQAGAVSQTVEVSAANAAPMSVESAAVTNNVQTKLALPHGAPVAATVTSGTTVLSLDASGNLFFRQQNKKRWKAVKPAWQGHVTGIALLTSQPAATAGETEKAQVADDVQRVANSPVFQLTTDSGAVWLSNDGEHWRQR